MGPEDTISTFSPVWVLISSTIIKIESEPGKEISKAKIRHIWNWLFPKEPLPKITAAVLPKEDYLDFKNQMQEHCEKCGVPDYLETVCLKEWGEVADDCALVTESKNKRYLILIRSDSPHSLEEDLAHELTHIHNGDVKRRQIPKGGEPFDP